MSLIVSLIVSYCLLSRSKYTLNAKRKFIIPDLNNKTSCVRHLLVTPLSDVKKNITQITESDAVVIERERERERKRDRDRERQRERTRERERDRERERVREREREVDYTKKTSLGRSKIQSTFPLKVKNTKLPFL